MGGSHGLAEVDSVHEFHEEIVVAGGLSKVVDGDDVRVIESGEGLCFFFEMMRKLGVIGSFG